MCNIEFAQPWKAHTVGFQDCETYFGPHENPLTNDSGSKWVDTLEGYLGEHGVVPGWPGTADNNIHTAIKFFLGGGA